MEKTGGKFVLEWENHPKQIARGLCMLMERQYLVDLAVCCGSNTLHAHKCILAASSTYFKEHLENKAIEQIIINGLDFSVMKALIEFMYSGQCAFAEDHLKHFIAAVRFFKIVALENIFAASEYENVAADEVCIPPPQFIYKPPKYPTVFKPFTNSSLPPKVNYALSNVYGQHKFKRKCLGNEAEKACAKEAQASRVALANLRKVMASTPQVHSFIVEESFNETTVENFIPNVEENYVNNIHEVQFVNTNQPQVTPTKSLNVIPVSNTQGLTADKIKHILGNDEVEIMFQTSDGNFVNVSDEVLLNLSKGGLQYQVVDENGHIGEIQELKALDNEDSIPNKTSEVDTLTDDSGLKREESFDLKIIKNTNGITKFSKAISEEYIPPNFPKTNIESLQLHTGFNEEIYENGFNMQNTEIFEPENLSMNSDLMEHNPMEFAVNDIKYKYLTKMNSLKNNNDVIKIQDSNDSVSETDSLKSTQNKSSLKFSPDMFFTELPDNTCGENKSKNPAETDAAK